ncbi:Fic family protein [uncultured Paraglaciecola sp.]|uniref:Fic family protein n=1 Tax=uncultured Paraglaciecola sp. TaxID=1765024 RepID=UPI002620D27D|nr:Fic family protein [uncultured Paraglaciecola sp.]
MSDNKNLKTLSEALAASNEALKILRFIDESNRIEGIKDAATDEQIMEHRRFMDLQFITIPDIERFISVHQPDAKLRDQWGMDVRVGDYIPPIGGALLRNKLENLLARINYCGTDPDKTINAYQAHKEYEAIHPFMDCNGRSGRMIWLWMMRSAPLGFLHTWYYQSLQHERVEL